MATSLPPHIQGSIFSTEIDHYTAFFQNGAAYYHRKLDLFEKGTKLTFNVPAFFLGALWMVYRKMYAEAAILLAIIFAEGFLEEIIFPKGQDPKNMTYRISTLLFAIITGIISNFLYLNKAQRTVNKAVALYGSDEQTNIYLNKLGGTTYVAPFVLLALFVILVIGLVLMNAY